MRRKKNILISFICEPLSRQDFRDYALKIRKKLGVEKEFRFPIIEFFDIIPLLFPKLSCEVVEDSHFSAEIHDDTDILNHTIRIRQSVYDGACNENGRDRMTIMHEIAHYLILCVNGIKSQRNFDKGSIKAYCDPEWQAKCLAGEIMIPAHLVSGLNPSEVEKKCGVSFQAAQYQLKKIS